LIKLLLFISPTCPHCPAAKEVAEKLKKIRDDVEVEVLDISNQENFTTALMLQVASTPTFVLEETPIFVGYVPSLEELDAKIKDYAKRICEK
jgi:protein-disulfide isomerase